MYSNIFINEMESVKRIKTCANKEQMQENWQEVIIKSEPFDFDEQQNKNNTSASNSKSEFDCKLCKKEFDTQSKLFCHLKEHFTTEEEIDKNQCKYCLLKFFTRRLWINHVNKHYMHNIKSYKCLECSKITDTPENLVNHYRIGNHNENIRIKEEQLEGNYDSVAHSILSILDWSNLEVAQDDVKYEEIVSKNVPVNRNTKFRCSFCLVTFRAREKYLSHLKKHIEITTQSNSKTTIFKCMKCEETFDNPEELTNHNKIHVQKVQQKSHNEICKYCKRTFLGRAEWISHVNQHYFHINNTFKCLECAFFCSEPDELVEHYVGHKNLDLSTEMESDESGCSKVCKICEKTFLTESGCRNHYSSVHRNFHQCYSCNEIFNSKKTLIRHQILTHEQYFPCEHCQKVYRTLLSLQLHREGMHDISLFECIFCEEVVFGARQDLLVHQEQIHRLSKYVCYYCFECFTTAEGVLAHEALHESDDGTEETNIEQNFALLTPQIEMEEDEGKVQLSDEN